MKPKTIFIIGTVLLTGAVLAAAAVAQNTYSAGNENVTGNEKAVSSSHECTPEMMNGTAEDGMENCNPEMMESGKCENMTDASMSGCSSMMNDDAGGNAKNHMDDPGHCSDSDGGSMMGGMMGARNKGPMM